MTRRFVGGLDRLRVNGPSRSGSVAALSAWLTPLLRSSCPHPAAMLARNQHARHGAHFIRTRPGCSHIRGERTLSIDVQIGPSLYCIVLMDVGAIFGWNTTCGTRCFVLRWALIGVIRK
jgi:hypothetical protein